jgi:hypothetical protein
MLMLVPAMQRFAYFGAQFVKIGYNCLVKVNQFAVQVIYNIDFCGLLVEENGGSSCK